MKERKANKLFVLMENGILQNDEVVPLMGRLQLYILIGLILLVTKLDISNSPPQVGRCSKHFQLEMRKYKEIHQANENTRKDAGNTSAKKPKSSNKCLSNKKQPQLKVEPIEGRSIKATLNHHPVEANINKAN
jgi:hypothetical protein